MDEDGNEDGINMEDLQEFTTEMQLALMHENRELLSMIQDNERYFPPELADLTVIRNPGLSLANLQSKEISLVHAEMAKIELLKLSKIPKWREGELRRVMVAFSQARIYLNSHLSLARNGYLLNKVTQISKIVSYHADTPSRPRRRFFPFFGGER